MAEIAARLAAEAAGFTPAEGRLAQYLLRHYPGAGLGSITPLAAAAGVSKPTVLRLARKLGFSGWPALQAAIRGEVEARLTSPILRHRRWAGGVPATHVLNRIAEAVVQNLTATLAAIDHAEFDALADRLADPARRVWITGGRITHVLADGLATQLRVMRPGVTLVPPQPGDWPAAFLDLAAGDVLVAFDIRRYEAAILAMVEAAALRGAEVALLTDPWVSPAAAHARYRLSAQVEVPSVWDSIAGLQVLVETLLAAVQERDWDATESRMRRLEDDYARVRPFGRRG